MVTHNPNIVVNGDAELIVALAARNGATQIECQGSLQEKHVREDDLYDHGGRAGGIHRTLPPHCRGGARSTALKISYVNKRPAGAPAEVPEALDRAEVPFSAIS